MNETDSDQNNFDEPQRLEPIPRGEADPSQPLDGATQIQGHFSPLRFLIITIGGIFLAEVVAMIFVYGFPNLPYYLQTLIDASIMAVLIFPVIYFLSLRPLLRHIEERKQAEDALRQSEKRFAKTFHSSPAALSITTLVDGRFIDANESFFRLSGYSREELIGHSSTELGMYLNPDERSELTGQILSQPGIHAYEMQACNKSGEIRSVYISTDRIELNGEPCILGSILDITERKLAEERLRRVNHALSVLNECNKVLVRAENEAELPQQMCEIIVNAGKYRMAWVGFAEQDQARSVRPAAQFGFEDGYLGLAQITWADNERGRGPTGTAIREGATQVNQNFLANPKTAPWRESALKRGYQSSIALPLKDGNSTFGALTIYSDSPDAFDEEEVHLLNELANNLAFGITALRNRAERKRVEDANRRLSRMVEQTEDSVVVTNRDGVIEYVNPGFERLTGYTREEALGKTPGIIKSGVHDSQFYRELWNTILRGDVFQSEMTNCKKNGELFHEVKTITPLRDVQGLITHFVATGKDITEHKRDEEKLRKAYDELELRVQERTTELEKEVTVRKRAETEIQQYAGELRAVNEELTAFNRNMVGRELRMIELKKEINALCESSGQPPRYPLNFEEEEQ